MGACVASAPALVVLPARWVPGEPGPGDWDALGRLWGSSLLWNITF